ncbi:hypothetical protein JA1_001515 [Spathaspora sp. JA1]|nr:hypothetical protein JA1_001515 [Spathaspora sp. JA1]
MATGQLTPPRSPSPTPLKRGFFNKLIGRKNTKKGSSRNLSQSTADSSSSSRTKKSNRNLAVVRSKSTNRGRSNSTNRYSYVDNDEFSLYNEDELESSTILSGTTEESSVGSFGQSITAGGVPTFNKAIQNLSFDNHLASEQVQFPNIENYFAKKWWNPAEEPPWSGLTYESFISPKYVKVSKRHRQSPRVVNNLFLAQELNILDRDPSTNIPEEEELGSIDEELVPEGEPLKNSNNEIFVIEFSKDGKYLAAAGRDSVIKIWKVISSPLGRLEYAHKMKSEGIPPRSNKRDPVFHSAPVFHQSPIRIFKGHTKSILSLTWSKNNFLISGSMDKTARLWHVDRSKCLQVFQHEDFVTTVKFHPFDDRFFLSGSLDNNVRLWSILEKSIAYTKNLGEDVLITALEFAPDGNLCIVGGFNGSVFVMETKGLFVLKRFEVKEKSLVNAFQTKSGNKITGIKVFENPFYVEGSDKASELSKWTVLITTNDSKIRMISTASKKLITRFKGLTNNSSSIEASSSEDGKYIIAGSEDHYCYIWENNGSIINNKLKQSLADFVIDGTQQVTGFHAKMHKIIPSHIKKLLEDDQKNEFIANENNSYTCFHAHHSKCNVAIFAPENTKKILQSSDDIIFDLERRGERCIFESSTQEGKPLKDKSNDPDLRTGHIVVTTDQYGLIRVFRQDSSREYRKKFVDCYKRCQDKAATSTTTTTDPCATVGAISDKYTLRSLSPSQVLDSSKQIRDILSTSIKATSSTLTPQSISTTINGIGTIPKVISSGSIMNLKQAARIASFQKVNKSQSDVPVLDSQCDFYANKNNSEVTLNAIPNQKATIMNVNEESFPSVGGEFLPASVPLLFTKESSGEIPRSTSSNLSSHEQLENLKITRSNSRGRSK